MFVRSLDDIAPDEFSRWEFQCLDDRKFIAFRPAISEMQDYFRIRKYAESAVVYREGILCKNVYFVGSGRVRLRVRRDAQSDALVELLGTGDLFGNLGVESSAWMAESAIADPGAEIWTLESEVFQTLMGARPRLAQEVLQAQHERICQQRQRLSWLTTRDVPTRLILSIIELSERFGEAHPKTGERALSGLTQQDLAEYIGSVRTFISTIISDLRRAGVISLLGRTLYVQNRRRLYELAGLSMPEAEVEDALG